MWLEEEPFANFNFCHQLKVVEFCILFCDNVEKTAFRKKVQ